jgi:DNA-binding response OmpR family regulator
MAAMLRNWAAELANDGLCKQPEQTDDIPVDPPRILIVDDDPAMSEIMARLLVGFRYTCVIRCSGAQATQAFCRERVDLIITDLRMAAGDGIALIATIRRTSRVPVIVVTGFEPEYTDRLRRLENVIVIKKPFECQKLVEAVKHSLSGKIILGNKECSISSSDG